MKLPINKGKLVTITIYKDQLIVAFEYALYRVVGEGDKQELREIKLHPISDDPVINGT